MASISLGMLEEMEPEKALYLIMQELARRTDKSALDQLYPDDGPLSRDKYQKHVKMLNAGAQHQERAALGGNRVGKTLSIGGYETALHLTGLYPDWWEGYRFDKKILVWAAGTKAVKVRDVNQKMLIGTLQKSSGMTLAAGGLIPSVRIKKLTRKTGVSEAVDQVWIEHKKGHVNVCTFKSYEEGRTSFEAEAVDFIWLDEEPTKPIYDECKMRLLTTKGRILSTFTPLSGMTETVLQLLEDTNFI